MSELESRGIPRMKVSELRDRAKVDTIDVEVVKKEEPREFTSKYGDSGMVCDAVVKDETGEVDLTLWNDEIQKVSVGNKIRITNGWVSAFRGKNKLSAGKYGKLEVL